MSPELPAPKRTREEYEAGLTQFQRLGPLRFLMQFDQQGAANLGACGMDEATVDALDRLAVLAKWPYKHQTSRLDLRGRVKVRRRYLAVSAGPYARRLATILRDELRQGNLSSINGLDDGRSRVAFQADWRDRRASAKAAAARAWARFVEELFAEGK